MFTKSLWSSYSEIHDHPRLDKSITTEVAVIGGGITGISAGNLLAQKGMEVAVLESRKVGGGTTGHSTGNLYYTIDKILSSIQSKYDIETVEAVAESRAQALRKISDWVGEYDLDCDYRTVPWYLYTKTEENISKIEKELEAARDAGLVMSRAAEAEIPFPFAEAAKVPDQAQINPMRYVQELARATQGERCRIYEHTQVLSVEERDGLYALATTGGTVMADNVIHATHSPKGVQFVHTLLGPYREYGIACRTRGSVHPDGIYWGYYEKGKKISTRTYRRDDEEFLIVIGEPHKVGQAENNVRSIRNLEAFARKYFDVQEVAYRWGGQHYRPADLLPYIGPRSKGSREYIATGYSTDGLVYGTLAGMMLSDLITGKENPWVELYDSTRKQPLKSAAKFLKENIDVAKEYLKDLTGAAEDAGIRDLQAGDGKVIERDGEKLAVSRNQDGKLQAHSAVCTHMGCVVNWNNAEKSWDCPCHGSRFKADGTVLEGPAFQALHEVRITGDAAEVEEEH